MQTTTPDRSIGADALRKRLVRLRASGVIRLDDEEIAALAGALDHQPAQKIALFGSRVEPERRGGDIDVLLLSNAPPFETSQSVATRFFARCEEKIDVLVIDPERATPAQRDFLGRLHTVYLT